MGKNAFLQKQQIMIKVYVDATEAIMKQFMVDTLQIAIHEEFGFGYDRIERLTKAWGEKYSEFYKCLGTQDAEADYLRECLDRQLKEVIGDKMELINFEERYPDIKKIKTGAK